MNYRSTSSDSVSVPKSQFAKHMTRFVSLACLSITSLALVNCGNVENRAVVTPITRTAVDQVPTDVTYFRDTLWSNVLKAQSCENCHKKGGTAEAIGAFADDNVSTSYNQLKFVNIAGNADANSFVDVANPSSSRMVSKVSGGHHCWTASCSNDAATIVTQLDAWLAMRNAVPVDPGAQPVEALVLVPPPLADPKVAKAFPALSSELSQINSTSFESTVYPLLTAHCSECHTNISNTPKPPYFAHSDPQYAYDQLIDAEKIDINSESNSRIYQRLATDLHNCWSGNCATDANEMLQAITAFANGIATPQAIDASLIPSKALRLTQGQISSGGPRFEQYVIAKYEFKEGSGNIVADTSTTQPSIDLQLYGNYSWVGGYGIEFKATEGNLSHGQARATSIENTKKLHDLIVPNNEYSIEAWVVPANVSQGADDAAMILSYGAGPTNRNIGIGQKEYQYAFFNRVSTADGAPELLTDANLEDAQASQQHIVMTYSPGSGRKFYVNGALTLNVVDDKAGQDPNANGSLFEWDIGYILALGADTDNSNPWLGKIRMLAIHNRALTLDQVIQNNDAGVGQKFNLLFSLDAIDASIPTDSYVWFEVSEYDDFSYLFTNAKYVNLDPNVTGIDINFQRMRLGVNGQVPSVGQAYAKLDFGTTHITSTPTTLSSIGTIIAKDLGVNTDQFFVTFETIAARGTLTTEPTPAPLPYDYDTTNTKSYVIGLKTFEEIHTTMSQLTGVPKSTVNSAYLGLEQALPSKEDITGFLASQQMAIANLALVYCDALVEDIPLRTAFFGGTFNFDAFPPPDTSTTGGAAEITAIATSLYNNMVTAGIDGIQPNLADVVVELTNPGGNTVTDINNPPTNPVGLYERLQGCFDAQSAPIACTAGKTKELVKTMCMAVLGSAAVTVQ